MWSGKSSTKGFNISLLGYARSHFRDFESYLRFVVSLDEDHIQLILKQYNSNIVPYELSPGIYSFKDISETVSTMGDHDGTPQNEYDDISIKRKLIRIQFGSTLKTVKRSSNKLIGKQKKH